jgi:hypothetical protein
MGCLPLKNNLAQDGQYWSAILILTETDFGLSLVYHRFAEITA